MLAYNRGAMTLSVKRMGMKVLVVAMLAVGPVACTTERNPAYCDSDADCVGTSFTFCDLNGEYPESNHRRHTCTTVPESCPVERCGCEPGAALSCDVDRLEVCNADGRSSSTATCALGCATGSAAEPRCLAFEPSNDLGGPLAAAVSEPDVVLPPGARIDTDLGLVQDGNGMPIAVRSVVVTQDGGTSIRAFLGKSFVISGATVRGTHALAFVAPERISLRGRLDASASGTTRGPGGQDAPAGCVGRDETTSFAMSGTGGGGNATTGGIGGGIGGGTQGGVAIPSFVPLVGGCRGGTLSGTGNPLVIGGGGGGAVQLVSGREVVLTDEGFIDVGGGGGPSRGGGGSGGNVVIEAPRVRFDGAVTGVAANGGAGGGCGLAGADGPATSSPAVAPTCAPDVFDATVASGGDGGSTTTPPQNGTSFTCPPMIACMVQGGGGGGAVGRLRVVTRDGQLERAGNPIIGASLTIVVLPVR